MAEIPPKHGMFKEGCSVQISEHISTHLGNGWTESYFTNMELSRIFAERVLQ